MESPSLPVIQGDAAQAEATMRELQAQYHVTGRSCGECTACCTFMVVNELKKPAKVKCKHCVESGCGIYESRPLTCRGWGCE